MVAETPPPAAQQQEAGAIVPVGQAQKSASGSVVNQEDIEQVKKLLTQVRGRLLALGHPTATAHRGCPQSLPARQRVAATRSCCEDQA